MKSIAELNALREETKAKIAVRSTDYVAVEGSNVARNHVLICAGTGCTSSASLEVSKALKAQLQEANLDTEVEIVETGCFGFCKLGPIMVIYPEGTFYCSVQPEDVSEIVKEHLVGGKRVERLLYQEPGYSERIEGFEEIPFFKNQRRIALRNCGHIDPEKIEEYIALDGYQALAKVVTEMDSQGVIDVIKKSGIRGRGGGGFPTGTKWQFALNNESDVKYVVCNADEGDPGAFMDRSILEGDPHSVIEAMAIAGYAIKASQGYVYIRAEYPIAVERLQHSINQAREAGVLGNNIFGSDFSFDLDIRLGAGAFVCGEETALLTSIEGNRGEPRPRPPFPAEKGLWEKPTIVNNVETFANIPAIVLNGPEWFSSVGTETSKGTKVFAIAGKINNVGLLEIPMGTTLRSVIYDIGGGIPENKAYKAAQTGGPSGGCLPPHLLDIEIDYDNLIKAGSMMGSGGLIVMDENDCMVDIAKFFLEFTQEESCGKCPPCRIGTKRMLEILEKITEGRGELEDIDNLEALAKTIQKASLCALGQTAPNPVLNTLKFFRDEYEAHIVDKKCPAAVCKKLLQYAIIEDKCKGCTLCSRVCPAGAINGSVKVPHTIDTAKCVKCGACLEKCKFGAIVKM